MAIWIVLIGLLMVSQVPTIALKSVRLPQQLIVPMLILLVLGVCRAVLRARTRHRHRHGRLPAAHPVRRMEVQPPEEPPRAVADRRRGPAATGPAAGCGCGSRAGSGWPAGCPTARRCRVSGGSGSTGRAGRAGRPAARRSADGQTAHAAAHHLTETAAPCPEPRCPPHVLEFLRAANPCGHRVQPPGRPAGLGRHLVPARGRRPHPGQHGRRPPPARATCGTTRGCR